MPARHCSNSFGQLGDGTTVSDPVTGSLLTAAVAIAAEDFHACAFFADGTVGCWGDNRSGQLGDGTTIPRLTPTPVTVVTFSSLATQTRPVFPVLLPLRNTVQIVTGGIHTCAIAANGAVLCWGDNHFGQLGIGSTTGQLRAVVVPSFTLNIDPQVALEDNDRVATVTILATCDDGQQLHVEVALTQGSVSGRGHGIGECTGGLARYPVTVPAQGRPPFQLGLAEVAAEASIRERGLIVDTQAWTRAVEID